MAVVVELLLDVDHVTAGVVQLSELGTAPKVSKVAELGQPRPGRGVWESGERGESKERRERGQGGETRGTKRVGVGAAACHIPLGEDSVIFLGSAPPPSWSRHLPWPSWRPALEPVGLAGMSSQELRQSSVPLWAVGRRVPPPQVL